MRKSETQATDAEHSDISSVVAGDLPLVSVLLPAFNEEAILEDNIGKIVAHIDANDDGYRWEVLIINDGSEDKTGEIADALAQRYDIVRACHHRRNRGLGGGIQTGVRNTSGDYLIVMDVDLSYDAGHIDSLLIELEETGAELVLASPYMKGGSIGNVPRLRKILSIWANWFLSIVAHGHLSTLTCMVRGYRGEFARSLVLRSTGMEVMPETIYKAMIMRGQIVQIPARLDWGAQAQGGPRKSSMQIARQILGTLLSGFLFRPFMFFVVPGLVLLAFSVWVNIWMVIHFFEALGSAPAGTAVGEFSWALAEAYQAYPHTFIVGLLSLMLAIQLISLGVLALQNKSYFEETFYLGSTLGKRESPDDES